MLYLSTNAKKPYNETRNYKPIMFFQTKAAITNLAFSLTLSLPAQCDLVKVKNMFILEKLMKNLKTRKLEFLSLFFPNWQCQSEFNS